MTRNGIHSVYAETSGRVEEIPVTPCRHLDAEEGARSIADYRENSPFLRRLRETEDCRKTPCKGCAYEKYSLPCAAVGRIPATQGAAIPDGLTDWEKIRAHRKEYAQGGALDWGAEFRRFTADKRNYTTAFIALSWGPYSAFPAAETGLSDAEWLEIIRKLHECAHFLCRRLFPEKIDAIGDEVTADAVGALAAFGE